MSGTRCIGFRRSYANITIIILVVIRRPVFHLKLSSTPQVCPYVTGQMLRLRYESNRLVQSTGFEDCILIITITIRVIIHRPVFHLKQDVSETGFSLRLQVKPPQLGPVARTRHCLRTPAATPTGSMKSTQHKPPIRVNIYHTLNLHTCCWIFCHTKCVLWMASSNAFFKSNEITWGSETMSEMLSHLVPYWNFLLQILYVWVELSWYYDRRSVGLSVLVSGTPLKPMTRFFLFLSFAGQVLCSSSWGGLSDERTDL
jgi:hypothetical protein